MRIEKGISKYLYEIERRFTSDDDKKEIMADIEARIEEIMDIVYRDVVKKNMLGLASGGIVVTGGTALMDGVQDVAEKVFNLPTRIASPENRINGLKDKVASPIYSTAVGLILYAMRDERSTFVEDHQGKQNIFKRMKHSISDFAKEFFA